MKRRDTPTGESTERIDAVGTLRVGQPTLVLADGPEAGRTVPVGPGGLLIGSDAEAGLRIKQRGVSRRHAELRRVDERVLLKDLDSTNGTRVNGTAIREAWLSPGDEITVGTARIRFQPRQQDVVVAPSKSAQFGALFGESLPMRQLFGVLERIAPTESTVLVGGETGTGKELVARALHEHSKRKQGPLIVFDCSSVNPELIGSELFGHKAGAFTSAARDRTGAFEAARAGTIFLDEVGELPLDLQPALLRALEAREVRPVGATSTIPIDVRVVAATHRDLTAMVRERRFREDLYWRLAVLHVVVPPLRDRREDIGGLARVLLERMPGGAPAGLTDAAVRSLAGLNWPGNVRELRNVLERSRALAGDRALDAGDLLLTAATLSGSVPAQVGAEGRTLGEIERDVVSQALARTGGNKKEAAKLLGIHRSTLYEMIKRYGLESPGD